jgi:hypothetical protein
MVLQEYNAAGARAAFWPYNASFGVLGQAGVLASTYAAALVMTAVAGTNATPASLTFNKAVIAPGFSTRLLFGSRLRNVPIRFLMLPYEATGNRFFS